MTHNSPPGRTPVFEKLCLILLGVALGGLIFEGFLRFVVPDLFVYRNPTFAVESVHPEDEELQMADPTFGAAVHFTHEPWSYRLKRDLRARFSSSEFDVSFETNEQGLRGPPLRAPETTYRILGLGDSFAMGYGVELEKMYLNSLGAFWDAGEPIEALNAGVVGYSPYNSFHYLLGDGLELNPDLVVMQLWVGDDLCGGRGAGGPQSREQATLQRQMREWIQHIHLAMFVRERLRSIPSFRRWAMQRRLITGFRADSLLSAGFAVRCAGSLTDLSDMFRKSREASSRSNARFLLLLIPIREQVYEEDRVRSLEYNFSSVDPATLDLKGPNRTLREAAERAGVELVDLLEPFLDHDPTERLFFSRFDPHMTPAGHRLAARTLARHLLDHPTE